jgi:hypothetical protein
MTKEHMNQQSAHIPLEDLWHYHTNKMTLTNEQLVHAIGCKH